MDQIYTWNCLTHFSMNFFNLGLRMTVLDASFPYLPLLKCVATKILFRLKITWNNLTFSGFRLTTRESTPEIDGISSNPSSPMMSEFDDSTSYALSKNAH